MIKKVLLIAIFCFTIIASSQVTNEGTPASWNMTEQKSSITAISLPLVDIQKVKSEDDINDKLQTKPYRIGLQIKANYGLDNGGSWTELSNGDRIWRILFESKDALNLGLIFDKFYLPKGAKIYLYNDDRTDLLGAYTDIQNNEKEVLTTWFVKGDKMWMEYYEPFEVKDQGKLNIFSVMHGYRLGHTYQKGYLAETKIDGFLNSSGDCNHDVDCPIGTDFESQRDLVKKGVGFLLIPVSETSVSVCTGTLINNTREDKTPYFLTANHCFGTSDPATYAIRFNWISPNLVCAGTGNSSNPTSDFSTMSGTTLRARNEESDFMLVEINGSINSKWDVTFAGWDRTDNTPNFTVGIHHPQGDIMKICRDNDSPTKIAQNAGGSSPIAQTWDITTAGNGWELGVTEGGSSGSALFDPNGRIIGQLYGGAAACAGLDDNDAHDFYGRFAISWETGTTAATRLKDWLDPDNLSPTILDAKDNVLAVNDEFLEANISVYPNPTSGELQIKTSGLVGELEYQVFNVLGQSLKTDKLNNNSINISNFSDNIYFVKITEINTNKSLVKKIVLNK